MEKFTYKEKVDHLIDHFWKNGYLTISRKCGTYLPEPKSIGNYNIEAVGKQKRKYVIGIILTEQELDNSKTISKLNFLATRNTKNGKSKVFLYIGVPEILIDKAKKIISQVTTEAAKNIKLIKINNR